MDMGIRDCLQDAVVEGNNDGPFSEKFNMRDLSSFQ